MVCPSSHIKCSDVSANITINDFIILPPVLRNHVPIHMAMVSATHVQRRRVYKGTTRSFNTSRKVSRRKHHSIFHGDGAYESDTFIWMQICCSGFPPNPGPDEECQSSINNDASGSNSSTLQSNIPILEQRVSASTFPCHSWASMHDMYALWNRTTLNIFGNMRVCAFCGHTALGSSDMKSHTSASAHFYPPYITFSTHMVPFATIHITPTDVPTLHQCKLCHARNTLSLCHVAKHTEDYVQTIMSATRLLNFQMLSIIDVSLNFKNTYYGYSKCNLSKDTLLTGALVDWQRDPRLNATNNADIYQKIYDINISSNPIIQAFYTVSEVHQNNNILGLSVLPPSAVTGITQTHTENAPTLWADDDERRPYELSTIVSPNSSLCIGCNTSIHKRFHVGRITPRIYFDGILQSTATSDATIDALSTAQGFISNLPQWPDTSSLPPLECERIDRRYRERPSLEVALFPFLFPDGKGFYNSNSGDIHQYLKYRMSSAFSLFTLYTPYVNLMYQVKQSILLLNAVTEVSLHRDIRRYVQSHPEATESDALRHVAKHIVPKSIPGSPMYHRTQLQNLLAMVDAYGMPNFFLTLTADEVSELKWPEYDQLEDILKDLLQNPNLDWKNAPVECIRLFKARVDAFFKTHIAPKNKSGILGKVNHYLIRYEFQDRGSPHVHIVLWVDLTDQERLSNEIIAYIPADYDLDTCTFIPHTCPLKQRLVEIVTRKQLHTCRTHGKGCRKHGACARGFPFASNEFGTFFDNVSEKWVYARPFVGRPDQLSVNRNVVPYHPAVALLWNAHTNLLRITAESWSFYVLKYATKMEPTGFLDIDVELAQKLCFNSDVSHEQLKLISATILTKPIAPPEAAHNMLQYSIIELSDSPHFVNTAPPSMRSRATLRNACMCFPPVEHYIGRPASMSAETFTSFFRKFILRPSQLKNTTRFMGVTVSGQYIYAAPSNYLVRFSDFHPARQTEAYAYNMLLDHVPFRSEDALISSGNLHGSYVHELVIRNLVSSDEACIEEIANKYSDYHLYTDEARQMLYEALHADIEKWTTNDILGVDTRGNSGAATDEAQAVHEDISNGSLIRNMESVLHHLDYGTSEIIDNMTNLNGDDRNDFAPPRFSWSDTASSSGVRNATQSTSESAAAAASSSASEVPHNPETHHHPTPSSIMEDSINIDIIQNLQRSLETLTLSQREIFNAISHEDCKGLHVILGSPGAGKTYMTKVLIQYFASQSKKMVLCSTTGVAATRMHPNATTVHQAMSIPSNGFLPFFGPTNPRYHDLKDADVVIVDEISMLTNKMLFGIMQRLMQVLCSEDPAMYMQKKLIIFVGDLCQLPPVCHHMSKKNEAACTDVCTSCHITYNAYWPTAVKHHLHTSYRHASDPHFAQFLNEIRLNPVEQSVIDNALSSCYITQDQARDYISPDTTILCSHCLRADEYNKIAMSKLFPKHEHNAIESRVSSQPDLNQLSRSDKEWYETWVNDPDFNRIPIIAKGAKVMLLANRLNLTQGVNGDVGHIVDWTYDAHRTAVVCIKVHISRTNKTISVYRSSSNVKSHGRLGRFRKTIFPLSLAYAITGHKSQGATLSTTTIVHMDTAFTPALAYVMLSRVTERRHLKIVGGLRAQDVIPIPTYVSQRFY